MSTSEAKGRDGYRIGEAWIRGNELVIGTDVGYDLPESHNCDANGCGCWHVIARLPISAIAANAYPNVIISDLAGVKAKLERTHEAD